MDILVISNYLEDYGLGREEGDTFEYVTVNERPKYDYIDYHAMIIDSRNLKIGDKKYNFKNLINLGGIRETFYYKSIVVILISEEGFTSPYLRLKTRYNFKIEMEKQKGKNITRELKQDRFLKSYAEKIDGYSFILSNSEEYDNFEIKSDVDSYRTIEPIAVAQNTRKVLGGIIDLNPGFLAILPALDIDKLEESKMLYHLIKKLKSRSGVEDIHFSDLEKEVLLFDELELRKNLESYKNQIDKINKKLSEYSKFKSILYLRGDKLVDSVILVLKEMGLKTFRKDIKEEDFWILDEERNKEIICEVKGIKKNCKREHINALDTHRDRNELKDDFPALLIINSFAEAKNLKSKDQEISPDIIKHAIKNNILVIRTLDLLYAFDLTKANKIKLSEFMKALKNESGWIRVIDDKIEIKKD